MGYNLAAACAFQLEKPSDSKLINFHFVMNVKHKVSALARSGANRANFEILVYHDQ